MVGAAPVQTVSNFFKCELAQSGQVVLSEEIFQSALNPDKLALLERWSDQAALDTHAKLNSTRPAMRPELRVGSGEREDYTYNRTR